MSMRILVADDHPLVRKGIVQLLGGEPGFDVCGEASTAQETIRQACELTPDIILLDVRMPGANGLETARVLHERVPHSKILIVSQHDSEQLLPFSLEAGAIGCLDKSRIATDLLPALQNLSASEAD